MQEAMMKDTLERAIEPNLNLKGYLQNAYVHPIFKDSMEEETDEEEILGMEFETESAIVRTKRQSRKNTPLPSTNNASSLSFSDGTQTHLEP